MQGLELGARIDAQFLGEQPADLTEALQGLALSAALVERQHPLGPEAFTQRVQGDQSAQLRERFFVPSAPDQGVDPQLLCGKPLFTQGGDDVREPLRRQVGQGLTPPQPECIAEQRHRLIGPVLGERDPALPDERGEPTRVQAVLGPRVQRIATALGPHDFRPESPAQPQDVVLHSVPRPARRMFSPQPAYQSVHRDDVTGVDEQCRQQRAQLSRANAHALAVAGDGKRTEDPELVQRIHSDNARTYSNRHATLSSSCTECAKPRP